MSATYWQIPLGHLDVTVWDPNLDIDSDNNNGTNYPDNSDWEEYLEDNGYGLGKFVFPTATYYTPLRLRLTPGLNPLIEDVQVRLNFPGAGQSGVLHMWNTYAADPARVDDDVPDGGNRLIPGSVYSLSDLNYDSGNGAVTIYIDAISTFPNHDTKQHVINNGKSDDRIRATLVDPGNGDLAFDEVKYMIVNEDTFYPHLNQKVVLRSAMASEGVYDQADLPQYALKRLTSDELDALFGEGSDILDLIGGTTSVPGLETAIYRDHVTGQYVLAFAGTNDSEDWIDNLRQNMTVPAAQYEAAMRIADAMNRLEVFLESGMYFTGHSLGGGLASAGAVVTGQNAYTFNAAGLRRDTLMAWDPVAGAHTDQEIYPGSLYNYDNASWYVDAYYLDWDILSFIQDQIPAVDRVNILATFFPTLSSATVDLFQPAIGNRFVMDGPLDAEMLAYTLFAGVLTPSKVLNAILAGSVPLILMSAAHTTDYYHYGLMVDESTGWDIFGVPLPLDTLPG